MDRRIPAYAFEEGEGTYLQLSILKSDRTDSAITPILSRKDIVEKRSYYSITERVDSIDGMKSIAKLLEMPSVAINNTYLQGGELFVDFRFHSSKLHDINEVIIEAAELNSDFRIVKMAHSRSLREKMEEISNQMPLSVVTFSMPVPESNPFYKLMNSEHTDAVAEVEDRILFKAGTKTILYTSKPFNFSGTVVISENNNIYETYLADKNGLEGRRQGNKAGIPRVNIFLSLNSGKLFITMFVPAAEASEFVALTMSALRANRNVDIVLEYSSELNEEVWNWL